MTEDRGQRTEDRKRRAESTAIIGLPSSVVSFPSVIAVSALLPLVFAAGCRNRALEQAQQEAREAKTAVRKMDYSLEAAAKEIATVKEELSTVRQDREELQKRVDQLMRERDQASTFAQQAQEAISNLTTRESGQRSVTAALEKQIAELKTLVDDQHKLIEQLKGAPAQPATTTAQATDKPATPDPNGKP
jgi:predicted  nucleic acid-binding Zn-ribbon protein